jgi:hypothetical protein
MSDVSKVHWRHNQILPVSDWSGEMIVCLEEMAR